MVSMRDLFPDGRPVSKDTLRRHLSGPVANVQGFGARGDGTADDTPAIRAAIADVEKRGGGIVYFPAGTYLIMPQKSITEVHHSQASALVIASSNISLVGDGPALTRLKYRVYGDRDPSLSFELAHWYSEEPKPDVWRGSAIAVRGSTDPDAPVENIVVADMEIDGGAYPGNTGYSGWPADVETGDGWDISHKGILLEPDVHLRRVTLRGLHVHNFRGEIIYGGGLYMDDFLIENCELHASNGDGISISASQVIRNNRIYDIGHACIESFHFGKEARYLNNHFERAKLGINLQTRWDSTAPSYIAGNTFSECRENGILFNVENGPTVINSNLMIDCGFGAAHHTSIRVQPGTAMKRPVVNGIVISQNVLLRRQRQGGMGIMLTCEAGQEFRSVVVSENLIGTDTMDAEGTNRFLAPVAYAFAPGAKVDQIIIKRNIYLRTQRHVENLYSTDGAVGAPMPQMSDNDLIEVPDYANHSIFVDGRATNRMENEGPIFVSAAVPGTDPTPHFDGKDYAVGQRFILTNNDIRRRIYIPQIDTQFRCREGRFLVPDVELHLRFDGTYFVEIAFIDRRPAVFAEQFDGTMLDFCAFHELYVAPAAPTAFSDFAGVGHGARVRLVAANGNVTLAESDRIHLREGADLPLGEGDVVELFRTRDGILRQIG